MVVIGNQQIGGKVSSSFAEKIPTSIPKQESNHDSNGEPKKSAETESTTSKKIQ